MKTPPIILIAVLGFQTQGAFATTPSGPITGTHHFTDDTEITSSSSAGIEANLGHVVTIDPGKILNIIITANDMNGISIGSNGGVVTLGETHIDTVWSATRVINGILTIGDDSTITGGNEKNGNGGALFASALNGQIFVGDNAKLIGSIWGSGSGAVEAQVGAHIEIGDGALIVNDGSNGVSYQDSYRGVLAEDATISIGNNSKIETLVIADSPGGNHGVMAMQNGAVTIGEGADITANGQRSYGLYSLGEGSKITVGSGSTIQTTGVSSYGVMAYLGGDIELLGDQTINIDLSKNSWSVLAWGGANAAATSELFANGKIVANGGMYALSYGKIKIDFQADSEFTGFTRVADDTSSIDFSMSKATFTMTTNSNLTSLSFNSDSHINFATNLAGGSFGTLTVDTLSGSNGVFSMRTDMENLQGDLLVINDTSTGNHLLQVNNQGGADVDQTQEMRVVNDKSSTPNADFRLTHQVEIGGYLYDLREKENDWYLYSTGKATTSADGGVNLFSGAYLLNYAETQTLLKRMGNLREHKGLGNVWARAYGGKYDDNGDSFLKKFDMNYSGVQIGSDKKIVLENNKGDIYLGGMFGYAKGDLDYGVGSGSIDSKTIGAYGTFIAPTGFYADFILKYGWMNNEFKTIDSDGLGVRGDDISTEGISASLELGQKFNLDKNSKEGWYLEPQAQLSIGQQSGGNFTATNGLRVDVESYKSTLGRLGLNVGYEVIVSKNPINVYGTVSYVHEFDGDVNYQLNNSKEMTSYGDSWWVYGMGITTQISEKHNLYLDIEKAQGGRFDQPWGINGGYRYSW